MATTVRIQNLLTTTSMADKPFSTFEMLAAWAFLQEVQDQLTSTDAKMVVQYNMKDHTLDIAKDDVMLSASIFYSNVKKRVTFWVSGFRGDEDIIAASVEYMADMFTPKKAADFVRKHLKAASS